MNDVITVLALILVANAAPVIVSYSFEHKPSLPVDFGWCFKSGKAVFGASKTWRGLFTSLLLTTSVSLLIDKGWQLGLIIASSAMAGDLVASFIKRRMNLSSSDRAILLDQVPESILPAIIAATLLSMSLMQVIVITVSFIMLELVLSKLFYKIGVRKRPY